MRKAPNINTPWTPTHAHWKTRKGTREHKGCFSAPAWKCRWTHQCWPGSFLFNLLTQCSFLFFILKCPKRLILWCFCQLGQHLQSCNPLGNICSLCCFITGKILDPKVRTMGVWPLNKCLSMSHLETSVTALKALSSDGKSYPFLMVLEVELTALHVKPVFYSSLYPRPGPWIRRLAHLLPGFRRSLNV